MCVLVCLHLLYSAIALAALPAAAQEPTLFTSSDTPMNTGLYAEDQDVVVSDPVTGDSLLPELALLPGEADVIAFARSANGDLLVAFDTTLAFPGGLTVRPGDVVRRSAAGDVLEVDRDTLALPAGIAVDAIAEVTGGLLLSFDTSVLLSAGVVANDEDIVLFDGASASLYLDLSALGIDAALDLDAMDSSAGVLLLSFDTSGTVAGIHFDDEDALSWDGAAWALARDGSLVASGWSGADLDAIAVPEPTTAAGLAAGLCVLAWVGRRGRARTLPVSA